MTRIKWCNLFFNSIWRLFMNEDVAIHLGPGFTSRVKTFFGSLSSDFLSSALIEQPLTLPSLISLARLRLPESKGTQHCVLHCVGIGLCKWSKGRDPGGKSTDGCGSDKAARLGQSKSSIRFLTGGRRRRRRGSCARISDWWQHHCLSGSLQSEPHQSSRGAVLIVALKLIRL